MVSSYACDWGTSTKRPAESMAMPFVVWPMSIWDEDGVDKIVITSDGNELGVDVHYTMPKVLSVSIAFAGPERDLPRYVLESVMDELAQIALKTGIDYAVIDYTLTCGDLMTEGNYSIDKRARVIRRL